MHGSAKEGWNLTRVSQPGSGCGQPLPRRVCACEALCCREKRHVHCGPSNPTLSDQASLFGGFFCRSLLCVVTSHNSGWRIVFQTQVFGRVLHSKASTLRVDSRKKRIDMDIFVGSLRDADRPQLDTRILDGSQRLVVVGVVLWEEGGVGG